MTHKCSSLQQLRSFPFSLHHIDPLHLISFFHPLIYSFSLSPLRGQEKVSFTIFFFLLNLSYESNLSYFPIKMGSYRPENQGYYPNKKIFNQKNFAGASHQLGIIMWKWDKKVILNKSCCCCCCCGDNNVKVFLSHIHTHILCDPIFVWTFFFHVLY